MAVRGSLRLRTVNYVYSDFRGRRAALIRALTTDVETLIASRHPGRKNLCLYGFPDGKWELKLPPEEVPSEYPKPAVGINFAQDGMTRKEWLYMVAVHSDCWLLAMAFYNAAGYGFDKDKRERLFNMINDLPTIFEIVTEENEKKPAESHSNDLSAISEVGTDEAEKKQSTSTSNDLPTISEAVTGKAAKINEEGRDEHGNILCGKCGQSDTSKLFWIRCDTCKLWFHGKCVMVSTATALRMQQYECLLCIHRRARP